MSIQIDGHNFEGPFVDANNLRKQSGVYTILGRSSEQERWNVVDIGEAGDVQERVSNHDRSNCWAKQGYRVLAAAAVYVPERDRMRIEKDLRAAYRPPCGDR